jgi:putative membrane protein
MTRRYWVALGAFLLVAAATWVHPQWPVEQALHHSLTLVGLVALVWTQHRLRMPFSSFVLILIFLAVHTVAARWSYSFVPYDDWSQALFGARLSDVFGWRRNHFDRLVHLVYGACLAPVLWRLAVDRLHWRRGWAALAAVDVVLSTGALYELFEWGTALVLAPGMAEAYNGQQGDMFDPHKDMAIAVVGALLSLAITLAFSRRPASPRPPDVS